MASNSPRKMLKEEATCFICWDYYTDPLILSCGHNFCQACVFQCWSALPDNATCPQCRAAIDRKNCHPNWKLTNVVKIAKRLNDQLKEEVALGEVCKNHPPSSAAVFCKEELVSICLECAESQQHSEHVMVPVEVAAQEYKDFFLISVEVLKEERAEIKKANFTIVERCEQLLKQTNAERQVIVDLFKQLQTVLSKQENDLLQKVEPVTREIIRKRNEDLGNLSIDTFTLETTIRQLEEKCSQPATEILRDVGMSLIRCQKRLKFQKPEDFSDEFKWKRWELLDINVLLRGLTKYFTDTIQKACVLQKVYVTLDAESNHPQLLLSTDGKSVKWTQTGKRLSNSYKRFERHYCVVGRQEFKNGRYFWDVSLGNQGDWAVGVAKKSVKRKGFFDLCIQEGVFAVGKWAGQYIVLDVPRCPPLQLNRLPRKIRVSLNCPGGQVNFYDVQTAKKIFGFTEIGCFQDTFVPFFWLNGRTLMSLK